MRGGIATAQAIGRIRVVAPPSTSAPSASVAAEAFGDGTPAGAPSPGNALHPGRPFGLKFWLGVASVAGMWWIYHHLPE